MKQKYEKPIALPLGEAVKGSGECVAGSGVGLGMLPDLCTNGQTAGYNCGTGWTANGACSLGSQTAYSCSGGTSPNHHMYNSCGAGSIPLGICSGGTSPA